MSKLRVLELFAGVGACSTALERLHIEHEIVDCVEIDKYAVQSFNALHNTNFEPQDITTWDKNIDVDLIMHGSPCQDISLVGKQMGADKDSGTRSSLMYETIRIVEKLKPKYVIWENVRNILTQKHRNNFNAYLKKLEDLGYNNYFKVLNAKDYGIPQTRERVFVVSIKKGVRNNYEFPMPVDLDLTVQDLLEKNVPEKYYLSDKMMDYISSTGTKSFHTNNSKINLKIARPITTIPNKRAGTTNYISEEVPTEYNLEYRGNYPKTRRITPREAWRLMSFYDEDFDKVKDLHSDTQLYKQAGNSIVVNVLECVLFKLLIAKE